jgi:small subunit ribosomal protein S16
MALVIRFRQHVKNNRRCFRLVVADRRSPRDGKYVETLGWYHPLGKKDHIFQIKEERIQYWISQGAQISEKAHHLVKKAAPQIIQELEKKKTSLKKKKTKAQKPTISKEEKSAAKPKKTTKRKKEETE